MKIAFGTDHAAYELKRAMIPLLESKGYAVDDYGCHTADSCDHPDYVIPVAEAVARGEYAQAVVACGTGQGSAIGANKVPGIRAALCLTPEMSRLARAHNNANVLVLPARLISTEQAMAVFEAFISTPFEEGRHARRMDKIAKYEQERCGDRA